jgi:antitoxin ChpS
MPYTAKLRKVGGSVMLAIPPALLEALDLKSDTQVGMSIESGKLLVEPKIRTRYTLEALIAECDPHAPETEDDQAWTEAPAVGRELI